MAVTAPPPGVYVPVPTFYRPSADAKSAGQLQAKVDVQAQVDHSVFLAKAGIKGLILLGSTGEAIHLNRQERLELVSGVRKGLDAAGYPDYPIQAGVLTNGIDETLEWLNDYHKAGAQWGLVLVPGYFGVGADQENIKEWYTIIADKSPIPILMFVPYLPLNTFQTNNPQLQLPRRNKQRPRHARNLRHPRRPPQHRRLQNVPRQRLAPRASLPRPGDRPLAIPRLLRLRAAAGTHRLLRRRGRHRRPGGYLPQDGGRDLQRRHQGDGRRQGRAGRGEETAVYCK